MKSQNYLNNLKMVIKENLSAVDLCFNYSKDETWEDFEKGDILGFPAIILLFSVVDAMGSYDSKYGGWNHFKILNTEMFENQNLSEEQLKDLYNAFRDPLTHNNLLIRCIYFSDDNKLFKIKDNKILALNIKRLFVLCEKAFVIFKKKISSEKIEKKLENKLKNLFKAIDRNCLPPGNDSDIIGQISAISVSGSDFGQNIKKRVNHSK